MNGPVLEIRRERSLSALRSELQPLVFVAVGGLGLVVVGVVQLILRSQPTETFFGLAAFCSGLAIVGTQARGLRRLWLVGTATPVVVRLDDVGVALLNGDLATPYWCSLAWPDVDTVELATHLVPAGSPPNAPEAFTYLRFVPKADDRVSGDADHASTHGRAALMDISRSQARMAMLLGPTTSGRIPRILAWLTEHRPEVPVVDGRHTSGS